LIQPDEQGPEQETSIDKRHLTMPLVIGALILCFAALSPQFLTPRNLSMLLIELSITAVLAVGMLVVILPGQIDLSAGSGVGLIGGVAAVLIFRAGWPAPLALLAASAVALVIWASMGTLIAKTGIQSFIVTLGGLLAFRGAFWLTIRSSTVPISTGGEENVLTVLTTSYLPPRIGLAMAAAFAVGFALLTWMWRRRTAAEGEIVESVELSFLRVFTASQIVLLVVLACNQYRGLPLAFVILCVVALTVHVVVSRTPFGRYLYAVGGNVEAAALCGIPVKRLIAMAYTLMGALVALTGFLQTSYAGASTVSVGELMELDAVAACVIGGASLKGGRGTVLGTLFGSTVMATLLNAMTLLAIAPEIKYIVRGTVLVAAVLFSLRFAKDSV
jgi:D-xylose transport system permease protein